MLKRAVVTVLVIPACLLLATAAMASIESFDASSIEASFDRFREIDFEDLRLQCGPLPPPSPGTRVDVTNLRIRGVSFTDPDCLSTGFCSVPTCSPDPQNPDGGNVELFLNPGGEIAFPSAPRLVVLDVQGIGDNPFELSVTDARGQTLTVNGQGVLFGRTLLGLRAGDGVARIAVLSVGGTRGPIAVARLLFSQSGP